MCGIAGIVKWSVEAEPPAPDALAAMQNAITHRGPDGHGTWVDPRPNRCNALLHARLAIIDLPCGAQPMANETGDVHVVFNGEIYNHAELRRDLVARGHRFATDHSDTEVLVHGWEEWAEELPAKLVGMFAFAIYDQRQDTLFMARDRMGQKPLFYANLEDGLVFASTINSILAWPETPRRVPREAIALYLQLGYLPPPQTFWRDISQLLPGGWLRLRGDVLDGGKYWPAEDSPPPAANLRETLTAAVDSQLIADVPIACFLSGGIDSSIIAALMQQAVQKRGGGAIKTVSVGFGENDFDETHYAAEVARKIGSAHTRLEVRPDADVLSTLQHLVADHLGQPFADSSILPTYHLSKAVRAIAPVALSGDGADELFGGYDRYRALNLGLLARIARYLPKRLPLLNLKRQERLRRLAAAATGDNIPERYTRLVEITPLDTVAALLGEDPLDYHPLPEEYGLPDEIAAMRYAMRRDQQEYLPGDVLYKVDTASMAHALEVRSPFLDHRVVDLARTLPDAAVTRKAILRETFAAELPDLVRTRGKQGFGVPIGQWFNTTLKRDVTDLLLSLDLVKRPVVEQLLREHHAQSRDHTHRLFALLTLALWRNTLGRGATIE